MSQVPRGNNKKRTAEEMPESAAPVNNILSILNVGPRNFDFYFAQMTDYIVKRKGSDAYVEDANCGKKAVYQIKTARFVMSNAVSIADMSEFLRPDPAAPFKVAYDFFEHTYLAPDTSRRSHGSHQLDMQQLMKRAFFKAGMVFTALFLNKFNHFGVPYDAIERALDGIADFQQQECVAFWQGFFAADETKALLCIDEEPAFGHFQMLSQYLFQRAETLYFKRAVCVANQPAALDRQLKPDGTIEWVCAKTSLLPKKAVVLYRSNDIVTARVSAAAERDFMFRHFAQMGEHKYLILLFFIKHGHYAHFHGCFNTLMHAVLERREGEKNMLINSDNAVLIEKRLKHLYTHCQWYAWSAQRLLCTIAAIMMYSVTKFVHQDALFYWDGELQSCQFIRTKMIKLIDEEDACVCNISMHLPHAAQRTISFDLNNWKQYSDKFVGTAMFFMYALSALPTLFVPLTIDAPDIDRRLERFTVPYTLVAPPHYLFDDALVIMQ